MTSAQRTSPGGAAVLAVALAALLRTARTEAPANGVRPTNLLGGLEQHASFSLVRPGLTQTAFAFNGPSSHQQFSSSVGDPNLAHRLLPNLAHAHAYRNPGLGYQPVQAPIQTGYAAAPVAYQPPLFDYQQQQQQQQQQQPLAHAYHSQIHPYHQQYQQQPFPAGFAQQVQAQQIADQNAHQPQLGQQFFAARLPNAETQPAGAVPEQIQLQQQQEQQTANLLGVAYSAAPSVAHVKVSGGGYKFDF